MVLNRVISVDLPKMLKSGQKFGGGKVREISVSVCVCVCVCVYMAKPMACGSSWPRD